MVVGTGITAYGKGGSLSLSTISGDTMSLVVRSSIINEVFFVRMLAGSTLGSNMDGGLKIVSGLLYERGIGRYVDLLSRGSKMTMGGSA